MHEAGNAQRGRPFTYYIVGDGQGRFLAAYSRIGVFRKIVMVDDPNQARGYRTYELAAKVAELMGWSVIERVGYE